MDVKSRRFVLCAVVLLGGMQPVLADIAVMPDKSVRSERSAAQEVFGGLVANQTVTVAGQDFFQSFTSAWRERDLSDRFAISITERPSARWGSQIWIEYAQRRIFQASLPTGRAGIKALSDQAVEIAYQRITDAEVERLLFRDADLGPDEM